MYSINDINGQRTDGFPKVAKVITEFYQTLLGQQKIDRARISQTIIEQEPALMVDQQMQMCKAVTDKEIQEVIFSIPNEKSLGPNPSGFFKAYWAEIGQLVCAAIHEFFTAAQLRAACNSSNLVILPTVSNPMNATDFRPISCCTVIYKVISKLLCNRLKQILPLLINQSQAMCFNAKNQLGVMVGNIYHHGAL